MDFDLCIGYVSIVLHLSFKTLIIPYSCGCAEGEECTIQYAQCAHLLRIIHLSLDFTRIQIHWTPNATRIGHGQEPRSEQHTCSMIKFYSIIFDTQYDGCNLLVSKVSPVINLGYGFFCVTTSSRPLPLCDPIPRGKWILIL